MYFFVLFSNSGPKMVCFVDFDLEIYFYHNGIYFFDILISKSGSELRYLVHFDLEIFFRP